LRLILAHISGKLKFELRPRRPIKLNEFLDLLDRSIVAFQDSNPISSRSRERIHEANRSSHCTRTMDDGRQSMHISTQVSGKVPNPPTAGELAMDL
jgi:hypothetical protein